MLFAAIRKDSKGRWSSAGWVVQVNRYSPTFKHVSLTSRSSWKSTPAGYSSHCSAVTLNFSPNPRSALKSPTRVRRFQGALRAFELLSRNREFWISHSSVRIKAGGTEDTFLPPHQKGLHGELLAQGREGMQKPNEFPL